MALRLLLRLDARRIRDAFARPAFWAGAALPALLLPLAAWLAGDGLRPDLRSGDGRFLLGLLIAGPVAFQSYPVLFRPSDDALLRRLGLAPGALFRHRALRLLALTAGIGLVLWLPFVRAGEDLALAAGSLLLSGVAAWGCTLFFTSRAADLTVDVRRRRGFLAKAIAWDRELAANAPLVYAPLPPVVAAAFATRLLAPSLAVVVVLAAAGALLAALASRRFERALPRFAPHAGELAWAPEPADRGGELVTGRGLPGLLPRAAQFVLARDALVASRRFRWAARLVPAVGVIAALVLLRDGDDPATRRWAVVASAGALVALGGVVLALGRAERGRTRWIDRALGLRPRDRLIGRASLALGRAAVLTVPVALAWLAMVGTPVWPWLVAAAVGSVAVAGMSLAAAGR